MELKTNRTVIGITEPICSLVQEQSVELDYVLPDYYPDVCKLVKCFITPAILSESVSPDGTRLSYELRADVRILYCSEENHILQCVTQTMHFSRTAELGTGCEGVTAELTPVTDYVNCRAVSRRRLDVRGAVTVRIRTAARRQQEVICDIAEKTVQQKKTAVHYPSQHLHCVRSIVLAEETELSAAAPPMLHVVRCEARAVETTHKIVSGKLLVQGGLQVQLLYACERDGDGSLEPLTFRIPYSQLVELEGLEEQDLCTVHVTAASCDLKPVTDASGDVRKLRCEAELRLSCHALRMSAESLVCDAFSTEHPCTCTTARLCTAGTPVPFTDSLVCSPKLTCTDGEPECVYDAWCEVRSLSARPSPGTGEILLEGMLCCNVLIREKGGMPRLLEKEEPIEHRIPMEGCGEQDFVEIHASVESCTYTLAGEGEIALKTELCLEGSCSPHTTCEVLTEAVLQEDAVHPKNHALKLYFATENEEIWDIAKRCHTSVSAIMEENDLMQETMPESGMLLIPIVH